MTTIPLGELTWPYRPDLLIRIDFLDWWQDAQPRLWPAPPAVFDASAVRANAAFFAEARRHPYFVQYCRKKRYWSRPLPLDEAEGVYADGVARFLNLLSSIERDGYDPKQGIELKRAFLQRPSRFGEARRRRWFIGNGCHRFACLSWQARGRPLAQDRFTVARKLVHRPLDWRGMLTRLGVLGERENAGFDRLFADAPSPSWDAVVAWNASLRERFSGLDLKAMFELRVTG